MQFITAILLRKVLMQDCNDEEIYEKKEMCDTIEKFCGLKILFMTTKSNNS